MRNLKVRISYKGTAYHGFQRQNNAVSVQNILEDRLSRLTSEKIAINGCSRTDTGVHANEFYFSFKTMCKIPCEGLVRGMNSLLPGDIAVYECTEVDDDFHARYSCKGKEYVYKILNTQIRDPFLADEMLHYPYPMDIAKMQIAASYMVGTHDFRSFCGALGIKDNTVRTVYECEVGRDGYIVTIRISGDGFLYNMVRIIVGTLIEVNEGKILADEITSIINSRDRGRAGATVKSCGLYLNKVFY